MDFVCVFREQSPVTLGLRVLLKAISKEYVEVCLEQPTGFQIRI
jgi:hypothetical protein